ncbi:astacin-like metalloprotease toxin 3, partial [Hyalella azteca]|uniref:Metalloendopeptidase n=1 Tax=Hyalella azteca TaxID=294128 RepID=A0A8B7NC32_HYAAZ
MSCSVNIVVLNLALMVIASCVIAVPANYGVPRGSLVSVVVDGVEYSPLEYHRKHHLFRNMYPDETMWPIGADGMVVVPYQLGVGVNKLMMERAMRKWEKDTCIRFREMAATEVKEGGYLQIKNAKECTANVGINPDYPSVLKIEDACTDKGFIHELAHVMGFAHETSRSDRDKYVHVHRENVDSAALYDLYYGIIATNNFDVPFDYNSIMIASEGGTEGKLVVVSLNPLYQTAMGSDLRPTEVMPSFMNTKTMNRIYKCVETNLKTCKLKKDPCLNHGYMGPACACLCPPGTSGKNCQVLEMSYQ